MPPRPVRPKGPKKSKGKAKASRKQPAQDPKSYPNYFNRELSWLHFNARVLEQAADKQIPLLNRLNFLGIFTNNCDEFFMKRVGGLKRHLAADMLVRSLDGLGPKEQLRAIGEAILPQMEQAAQIFLKEVQPELTGVGIELLPWGKLSQEEKKFAEEYFRQRIFPLLTPLAVDAGHPFPFLSNLSTSLGVALGHPERDDTLFARVKISSIEPQWVHVNPQTPINESCRFISVRDLITHHIDHLFPKMSVLECMPFRVTRSIALEVDEENAEDLRALMEEELRQRRLGMAVRLEHGPKPSSWIRDFLQEELSLHRHDIYEVGGELEYSSLQEVARLPIAELTYRPWVPVTPPALQEETSIFSLLRARDLLIHRPFDSFASSVERFVREAAEDSRVRSIKMTVYRVGDESPIIPLLIKAAERGKNVVCLVELKARFDEQRNMLWAQKLEEAGVHVIYGIAGLKIHAKTLLVIRDESEGVRCYAHIGTGNYHSGTANLYTDFGLFTAKRSYTDELVHFFNYLTGRSVKDDYQQLLVAPMNMAQQFHAFIEREITNAEVGKPAHIVAKMNSLEDREIIDHLYRASQAGVKVDLYIRGVCCLRPGIKGLSEKIRVLSVVGRLLEHSRTFYFRNGAADQVDGEFYIGSADWMSRNLYRRIEVIAPVEEQFHRERIWQVFQLIEEDYSLTWELKSDGSYARRVKKGAARDGAVLGSHELLMELARRKDAG